MFLRKILLQVFVATTLKWHGNSLPQRANNAFDVNYLSISLVEQHFVLIYGKVVCAGKCHSSLLAKVSHDEAKMRNHERPLLAEKCHSTVLLKKEWQI